MLSSKLLLKSLFFHNRLKDYLASTSAGSFFVKPVENEMVAVIGTTVDVRSRRLRKLYADLRINRGRLSVDEVDVRMSEDREEITLAGKLEAEEIQDLIACYPKLDRKLLAARGYLKGDFSVALGRSPVRAALSADLGRTTLQVGDYFRKPAVSALRIGLDVSSMPDTSKTSDSRG